MKELELTLRLRNNRLKQRRLALGMSQAELAKAAGMSMSTYSELECLRRSPRHADGGWTDAAIKLAHFHRAEPGELFPQAVRAVKMPIAVRRLDGDTLLPLLGEHSRQLLLGAPDAAHDRAELRQQVQRVLGTIQPRYAEVLRLRFGLGDGEERTLKEVGDALGVSECRASQLETRALRRLKHPSRANALRELL